ncbi:MAG TPA: cupin domain-containing protein [Pyrinomonadaceae bacterium]
MKTDYKVVRATDPGKPDAAELRQTMSDEGYRVYQWSDAPGTVYSSHQHPTHQSHWIISGKLELEVCDVGTFVLQPGDRDFMPAGTYHSARVLGDESVVYLIGEL